jgi:hypothetical protein
MIMPSKLEESLTSEQRLDRLEADCELFVAAGLRARRNMREMDKKMNILIDAQIRNEERFANSDERFARFEVRMDQTLRALMEIVKKRNGNS